MFRFPIPSRLTIKARSGRLLQISPVLGVLFCLTAVMHSSAPTASARVFPDGPVITSLSAGLVDGNTYVIHGHVNDANPLGVVVTFSGLPSVNGYTISPNANGDFSFAINLKPGESGEVSAIAVNEDLEESPEQSCMILPF